MQDIADQRRADDETVPPVAALAGVDIAVKRERRERQRDQQVDPVIDEEVGRVQQQHGLPRQLDLVGAEELRELRDHEQVDDRQRDRDRDDDRRRVAQRGADIVRDAPVAIDVVGHQREGFLEPAGILADLDHADVQVREHPRMARARDRQVAPRFELLEHVAQRLDQQRVLDRLEDAGDRARDRDARLDQRRHLAGEHQQFLDADLVEVEAVAELRDQVDLDLLLDDRDRRDAAVHQRAGDRGAARALEFAVDQLAVGTASLELEVRHQLASGSGGCSSRSSGTSPASRSISSIVVSPLAACWCAIVTSGW